jgi:hypothetical protein
MDFIRRIFVSLLEGIPIGILFKDEEGETTIVYPTKGAWIPCINPETGEPGWMFDPDASSMDD